MLNQTIPTTFSVMPYGEISSVTPLISRTRVRIYYLGRNRNYTYITEEMSDKLVASLPYTPIVGTYSREEQDFLSHQFDREEARIYGLVPENPNIAWEDHEDEDGIVRSYLCCDVYLYTGRYEAANLIPGHPQSMELNGNSIQGYWKFFDNEEYFVFTNAFFDGLCVLGTRVEPCFEGAAFFSKQDFEKENAVISLLEKYVQSKTNKIGEYSIIGGTQMDEEKVITSVEEIEEDTPVEEPAEAEEELEEQELEEELEAEEEGEDEIEEEEEVADEFEDNEQASANDLETAGVGTQADELAKNELPDAVNGDPAETSPFVENYLPDARNDEQGEAPEFNDAVNASNVEGQVAPGEWTAHTDPGGSQINYEAQILELQGQISTFETEISNLRNEVAEYKAKCEAYELAEQERLSSARESKLAEYEAVLSETAYEDIKAKLDTYSSIEDLEKDILYTLNKEKPLVNRQDSVGSYSTIGAQQQGGIIGILNTYRSKKSLKD